MAHSQKTRNRVIDLIAEGLSLRQIGKIGGMPNKATVMSWVVKDKDFREQYARAKEIQSDAFAEEILDIADDASNDWMERHGDEQGNGWRVNGDNIQRSKLRIDARKWLMGKMKPKKYGNDLDGDVKAALIVFKDKDDEEL